MEDSLAYYREIRHKMEHESSMVNNRMTWHHVIQAAFVAFLYKTPSSIYDEKVIPITISILGILLSLSAWYSLWISEKARAFIFMCWDKYLFSINKKPEDFPPISGDPWATIKQCTYKDNTWTALGLKKRDLYMTRKIPHFLMLYKFIPILCGLMWIVFLFYTIVL